ncbi:MAG: transporter substrate-binding domain-containing protein [Eubacteriales bacterium]
MKRKILATLLCGAMVLGTLVGCSSETEEVTTTEETTEAAATEAATTEDSDDVTGSLEGVTLSVGTSGLFGPFSYYDEDGSTLIGYDIDLIYALQDILGFEIEGDAIQAMDYSALTTSLSTDMLDIGAAALCATDERKEVMTFTETYCDSGQILMINSESDNGITSLDDITSDTVVAVESGTASHTYASLYLTDCTIEVHDTITTAYESLEQGMVDCLIQDAPGAAFYIAETEGTVLAMTGDEFNQGQAPYAVAISFGCDYAEEIDAALAMLAADGTLDELYATWCE